MKRITDPSFKYIRADDDSPAEFDKRMKDRIRRAKAEGQTHVFVGSVEDRSYTTTGASNADL